MTSGTCDSIAAANGITTQEFFRLNPTVENPACRNMYSGCSYCISDKPLPDPCPKDYDPKCDKFYTVNSGDICYAIVDQNQNIDPKLTLPLLFQYNPSIHNPSCDNLRPNCNYCVHIKGPVPVPGPHQPNIRVGCKEYYMAIPGDFCWKISVEKGVNLNDFMTWNPDVGPGCMNMLVGYWYCLRI